jgi:hypothetical protein
VLLLPLALATLGASPIAHAAGVTLYPATSGANSSGCPSSWSCADIGKPLPHGSDALANGTWTVQGSGDIWGSRDNVHFDWQTLAGDGALSAEVLAQTVSDPWAKAGVMLRGSPDRGAPFYAALVTPGHGIIVQYRKAQGATAVTISSQPGAIPTFLRVVRVGTAFSASSSADGVHWTLLPRATVSIGGLSGPVLAGLAVTSHKNSVLSTATFSAVGVEVATACPSPWSCANVGKPFPPGSASSVGDLWMVQGSGDLWGVADNVQFDWQALSGNGAVSARVLAQTVSDPWAKAGVMLRGSIDRGAPFYAALATPGHGIIVQYRQAQGARAVTISSQPGGSPVYLRVARTGTTFSAYSSADGINWSQLPRSAVTISSLGGPALAGLAVTSHKNGKLSAATFEAITIGAM